MSPTTLERRSVTLEVEPVAPFDFLKALTMLELRPLFAAGLELGETTLGAALWVGDPDLHADPHEGGDDGTGGSVGAAFATVRSVGSVSDPRLEVRLDGLERDPDREERRRVETQLEGLLGLSDDLEPFYEIAREDPAYWRTVAPLEGLHRIGFASPFEGVAWTILKQREYPTVARARHRRLREALGGRAVGVAGALHAFPSARVVAATSFGRLGPLVKKRRKSRYLRSAADAFAEMDEREPGWAATAPPAEVRDWLESIRGVGPWTARTFLTTVLGRPRLELLLREGRLEGYWREVLARPYGPGIDAERALELAERYGEFEELWLWYARAAHHLRESALARG